MARDEKLTFREAALALLEEAGEPLHYKELARRILERELTRSSGRTPEETLRAMMMREIRTEAEPSFAYLEDGFYGLARWGQSRPPPRCRTPVHASGRHPSDDEQVSVLPGMECLLGPREGAPATGPRVLPAPPPGKSSPPAMRHGPSLPFAATSEPAPEPIPAPDAVPAPEPAPTHEPVAEVLTDLDVAPSTVVFGEGVLGPRPEPTPLPPPTPVRPRTILPQHRAPEPTGARRAAVVAVVAVLALLVACFVLGQ